MKMSWEFTHCKPMKPSFFNSVPVWKSYKVSYSRSAALMVSGGERQDGDVPGVGTVV